MDETQVLELAQQFYGKFGEAIAALTQEYLLMSEEEIAEKLGPTPKDWVLRRNFWRVVEKAKDTQFDAGAWGALQDIYGGACSRQYFNEYVITNPLRVAWIIKPIIDHGGIYEAINRLALDKVFKALKKVPDEPKYLQMLLKVAERSADRAYGQAVQRIQLQSRNVNMEVNAKQLPPSGDSLDLTAKLEEARSKLLSAPKEVHETGGDEKD